MTTSPFTALGNAARRRILELLADGEKPVADLVAELSTEHPISQPGVSQHLQVLNAAGLVRVRRDGRKRRYALDPAGFEPVNRWLADLTEPPGELDRHLDALATEVARGRRRAASARTDGRDAASA